MKKLFTVILFCFVITAFANNKVLNIYNWGGYLPDKVLDLFQKETGIHVNYSTFVSNEELFTKVKADRNGSYDIIVPSTSYVQQMIRDGMLHKLDKSKLSNFKYLNPELLDKAYDPNNVYSLPYLWGTNGILLNIKYYSPEEINSWQSLWNPKLHGQLALLNDVRDVFAIAMKILGYSVNDENPEHIKQAYLKLKELLPNVQSFESDGAKHLYINEDSNVGMVESGDAAMILRENKNFRYIYPSDGAIIWIDSIVIPEGARNLENAYKFINFVLRPEIAKMISEGVGFSTPNLGAIKLMSHSVRKNRILNPTKEDLKNSEYQGTINDQARKLYLEYWGLLKLGDS